MSLSSWVPIGVFLAGGTVFLEAPGGEGLLMALVVWLVGALYLFLVAGLIYLGLGIYNNTRRTAEAVEQLVARS